MTADQRPGLVRMLRALPEECEWAEFKHNNADPEAIGEYASALANGAALVGKPHGFLVWGIEDATRALVGTVFRPTDRFKGQSLDNWLSTQLSPQVLFQFLEVDVDGVRIVVLEVAAAESAPVRFKGTAYVRVGSHKKRLADHIALERQLWKVLHTGAPEEAAEAENLSDDDVLSLLDVDGYYRLVDSPRPDGGLASLAALASEQMIRADDRGTWEITRFGALAIGRDLKAFNRMGRKGPRVIEYADQTRLRGVREHEGVTGYALGFSGLLDYIRLRLPSYEHAEAIRRNVEMYPALAIRELVANALVHQDLSVLGAGPTIEIFSDRIEISSPGVPLVDTDRFLDTPPRSRNEKLAAFMRRVGICEERGSGIDKVVFEVELAQLPAPEFRVHGDSTVASLFGPRALAGMDRTDRTRAVYLHTCLRFVSRQDVTNSTIRERFQLTDPSKASRLLKEAVEDERIRLLDETAGYKYRRYVPYWA